MKPFIQSRERNDCVVLALAHAADITYEQAHAILAEAGRKSGDCFWTHTLLGSQLGHSVHFHGIKATVTQRNILWREFIDCYDKTASYIINKEGHAFAVVAGQLYDHSNRTHTTRIKYVWKIERHAATDTHARKPTALLSLEDLL